MVIYMPLNIWSFFLFPLLGFLLFLSLIQPHWPAHTHVNSLVLHIFKQSDRFQGRINYNLTCCGVWVLFPLFFTKISDAIKILTFRSLFMASVFVWDILWGGGLLVKIGSHTSQFHSNIWKKAFLNIPYKNRYHVSFPFLLMYRA